MSGVEKKLTQGVTTKLFSGFGWSTAKQFALTLLLFLILFFLLPIHPVYALGYDDCEFTPEELNTPDEAIKNVLNGVKFCPGINSGEGLEPFDRNAHPPRAMRRVYAAKSSLGFSYHAVYADFDIKSKEKGSDIEGMEHYVYRIELLYVLIGGVELDVKGAMRDGYLPICERDVVTAHLIRTPFGWYPYIPTAHGRSIKSAVRHIQKHPEPFARQEINRYREISASCLNRQKSSR